MPAFLIAIAAAAAPELSASAIAAIAASGTAATGGIYYYRQEIYNGITSLLVSAPDKLTLNDRNQMKTDQEKMEVRQIQPLIIAEAAVANATTHVETVVAQTNQQQACIEESIQQLTETVSRAQNATQILGSITQPLYIGAMNAVNSVDVLEQELSQISETMTMTTAALNVSNESLSSVVRHIGETHTKLSSTLTHLTTDTSNADIQITRLADQKHACDALAAVDHDTIDHDELTTMKNKIRTLSHNFLTVIKENRALISENSALKKTLSLSMPKRQFSPEETHPKNNDTNRPSQFN